MKIRVTTGDIDGHSFGELVDYPDDLAARLVSSGYACPADGEKADAVSASAPSTKDLKERCRELGLPTSGTKEKLIARIAEAEAAAEAGAASDVDDEEGGDEPPALTAEVPR